MQPGEPTVVVVGAALLDRDRLLAARRSAPPELAGRWELPGGKVEPGESEEQALVRECREELGVPVALRSRLPGDWPLGGHRILRVWIGEITRGVPAPLEDHDQLRWLEPGEWDSVDWLPADLPVIAALGRAVAPGPPSGGRSGASDPTRSAQRRTVF